MSAEAKHKRWVEVPVYGASGETTNPVKVDLDAIIAIERGRFMAAAQDFTSILVCGFGVRLETAVPWENIEAALRMYKV